jgi:hypothetical protein
MINRQVELHTGRLIFTNACWDSQARGLVLTWNAETDVRNLVLTRVVVIGLSWPPVRWATRFVDIGT